MANTDPIYILSSNIAEVLFQTGDGTTPKDLVSAGTNGTKILSIACTSDDTAAAVMGLYVHDGTSAYLVGRTTVPTLSGTDGVAAAVNLMAVSKMPWLDADGEFFIPSGYKLQVAPVAAVTAAKTVTVVCFAGDY